MIASDLRRLAAIVLAVLMSSSLAAAQGSSSDRATAEALFREAKRLMGKKQYSEACPKLEESQRLDPQGGTLLNLAVCHAREGKTASAWAEFQEALALAREAKRNDRIQLAKRELSRLSLRLSHLVIDVPSEARVDGLVVQRGSTNVGEATWGVAVPVDPGEYEISASAPGHHAWSATVTVNEAERSSISVPELEKLPPPSPKPAKRPPTRSPPKDQDDGATQRLVGYVVGGAGIVALGVGSYFGLTALSKASESEDHCDGSLCDPRGLELNDDADRAATIANVTIALGLVGVGVGSYLVLSAPAVGTDRATILLSGTW